MAKKTLGLPGQIVAWVTCLLLLYALAAAYMEGNGSLLSKFIQYFFDIHVSPAINAIVFTLIFGTVVTWHTKAVDLLNRFLMSFKGLGLLVAIIFLMPHVNWVNLIHTHHHDYLLWAAIPIFLTAFGFHTSIPSLSNYLNADKKALKKVIFWGATIPLFFYLIWLVAGLGIVPLHGVNGFSEHIHHGSHNKAADFILLLDQLSHSRWANMGINVFSNVAMTTSFLGVTLGLFDFLIDGFKRKNKATHRIQIGLLTYIPPLIVAIFFAKGFILALTYAAIFVAILEVIMPAMMVFSLRRNPHLNSPLRVIGGTPLLVLVFLLGIAILAASVWFS